MEFLGCRSGLTTKRTLQITEALMWPRWTWLTKLVLPRAHCQLITNLFIHICTVCVSTCLFESNGKVYLRHARPEITYFHRHLPDFMMAHDESQTLWFCLKTTTEAYPQKRAAPFAPPGNWDLEGYTYRREQRGHIKGVSCLQRGYELK